MVFIRTSHRAHRRAATRPVARSGCRRSGQWRDYRPANVSIDPADRADRRPAVRDRVLDAGAELFAFTFG